MSDITEQLKKVVKFAGGQVKFAEKCGLRQGTISAVTRGRKPSLKTAAAIQKATGGAITIEDLRPDIFGA